MGNWFKLSVLALALLAIPTLATDEADPGAIPRLLIVEVQTGSIESASEEFVEIYNISDQLIDATNLKLQYRSANGDSWLTRASLVGELQPRGRYLISSSGYIGEADAMGSLGLAKAGGHIRLIEDSDQAIIYDEISWGTAAYPVILAASVPEPGESLKRLLDEDGQFIDSDNDNEDFIVSQTPSPHSSLPLEISIDISDKNEDEVDPPVEQNEPTEQDSPVDRSNIKSGPFAQINITELFIDPDKPLLDAEDEFVELYNPNVEPIDLEGYIIQSGSKFTYRFELPNITIKSGQYLAFFSLDTGLALTNSGGKARLLDPTGEVVFEVPEYEKAKADTSWALIGDKWQWTDTPTPSAPNVLTIPTSSSKKSSSSSSSRSNSSYSSRAGVLGANSSSDNRLVYEEPPAASNDEVDTAVVAGVGSMALLYAGYEYRYDVQNRFQQLKRYFQTRSGGRKES